MSPTTEPTSGARHDRRFDVVLYGATSFVGKIVAGVLAGRLGTDGPVRWAIAGRDRAKLDAVARELGGSIEVLVADASDADALVELARATRVVVSTVGPYARYGSPLVAAVAETGTDYCDLTGEPQWMRRMIDAHQDRARASGARIVHACGFDSIPSDLGVWHLQQIAVERFGEPCTDVAMRVHSMRGGASGGTVASMLNVVEEAAADPALRRLLADPYALAPVDLDSGPTQLDRRGPSRDVATGEWLAPFVMAAVNAKVVHRSHALLGRPWGPEFTYDEAMALGSGARGAIRAGGLSGALVVGMGATAFGPTRRAIARWVAPKPGEGPSPQAQERGSFRIRFTGTTASGETITTEVRGRRDPGYGCTARMLAEAAGALVDLDHERCPGGFWTPASAFGDALVERLEAHAEVRFTVVE